MYLTTSPFFLAFSCGVLREQNRRTIAPEKSKVKKRRVSLSWNQIKSRQIKICFQRFKWSSDLVHFRQNCTSMLYLSLTTVNFNSHWSSQHPLRVPPIIEISCLFVGEHRNVLAVSVPHSKLDKDVRWLQTPNYPSISTSYKFSNMALDFKTNVSMCMHVLSTYISPSL